ncbi:fibrinogen-like protein 1 [Littorina saxatilis]|uniref:fibrinogen-like protein 1 n=1 Tax=Littorina saxatilis TaxID=31220 RepID=UPI0038B47385
MTWDDANRGFGDDLNTSNASTNFFIGLDRLHLLLGQAEYTIDLNNMYDNWSNKGRPNYHNITVGPESSNYRLSYSEFTISDGHVVDNGLAANSPIEFSTPDHDTNGCNASSPGWYGSDCRGFR